MCYDIVNMKLWDNFFIILINKEGEPIKQWMKLLKVQLNKIQ